MLRAAPRREGVGLRIVRDIHTRHRQTRAFGERANHMHEIRRGSVVHFARAIHREHRLVRIPVGEKIGAEREQEGDHHPGWSADQITNADEQRRQCRHQNAGADQVDHGNAFGNCYAACCLSCRNW